MFPYPSGNIHLGHARNYITSDVIARYRKMIGANTIHPIGWDAFGLPAENAAIANNQSPQNWTENNIEKMKEQSKVMNIDFDWNKEIKTNDPNYYKWTQWLFIQMFKNNLVYESEQEVNYDPVDQTVLANEQVDSQGRGWRSGAIVEKRKMKQWFVKTTAYKQEMIDSLNNNDFMPARAKSIQKAWLENLHDWGISRQRFWGTPIPIIYCPEHGAVPVPEEQLPVQFPAPENNWSEFKHQVENWKNTTCPICGNHAIRSIETMDTFMDSSWYFYRYLDNNNNDKIFNQEKIMPMNVYIGGIEHANAHLIYARFMTKFLRDIGLISFNEPFIKYIPIGIVQGKTYKTKDGKYIPSNQVTNQENLIVSYEKMSKSKGNGIDPISAIKEHGIEAFRMYLMFKAPIDKDIPWDTQGIVGIKRFIQRVNRMNISSSQNQDKAIAAINDKYDHEYHRNMNKHNFNVAISTLMKWYNEISKATDSIDKNTGIKYIQNYITPFTGK